MLKVNFRSLIFSTKYVLHLNVYIQKTLNEFIRSLFNHTFGAPIVACRN